ncbi:MAG: hypothetical protein U0941_23960 [Planctomycetaceae bacterium]
MVLQRFLPLAILLSCMLSGCAIGPHTIRNASLGYNEVLHDTAEAELLLNLVRARYGEQPSFVEVASVTQQYAFTSQTTVQGDFTGAVFPPVGSFFPHWVWNGTVSETPTIALAPKFDDTFNQRLRSPISIDSMSILVWCGWNIDTVLRVTSNNINGLDNALMAGRAHPEWPANVDEFKQVTYLLKQLQLRGKVELVAQFPEDDGKAKPETTKDKRLEDQVHVLRFSPEIVGTPEHNELMRLLKMGKAESFYKVNAAAEGILKEQPPYDEVVLSRRSFSEVVYFMSHGIEVPCEHVVQGIAHQTVMADGQSFDWNTVTGDMFRVCCQKRRPKNAEVAVKYRGYWFYIDKADLASRYTLNFLVELYNMEVRGGGGAAVPLITIGAGGK